MKYANKKSKREFVLTFCPLSKEHYTVCVVVYDTYSGSGNLTTGLEITGKPIQLIVTMNSK